MKYSVLTFLTPKMNTFYLNDESTIRQVLEKFDYYKFSVVPLINQNGEFVSTISEGDILRFIKNNHNFNILTAESTKINEIEKYRPYKALPISTDIKDIIKLSLEQNFIPIVDDRNMYIGIIKRKSIIDLLINIDDIIDKENKNLWFMH